jgi:ribosomal protein S18 acetylase RimI-like enzyme
VNIEVRAIDMNEVETVRQLLLLNGWSHRVGTASEFETLIQNSDCAVVALANGVIVGFARAITDHLSNGYVSMLLVLPSHRRMGVGRSLMKNLLERSSGITWVLRASREGAKEFFSSLGFMPSADAMELRRQ